MTSAENENALATVIEMYGFYNFHIVWIGNCPYV